MTVSNIAYETSKTGLRNAGVVGDIEENNETKL